MSRSTSRTTGLRAGSALLTLFVLAACSSASSSDDQPTPDAEAAPAQGGDLRFAQNAVPTCLDIAQSPYVPIPQQQVVDTLLSQDPETGEIGPYLAQTWEVSADATQYTFHLRDDVTFSNGEPFTATSVQHTFDNAIELGGEGHSPQASAYLLGYTGTTVVDEHTAVVSFSAPKAGFLQAASEKPLGPISDETIAAGWEARCAAGVIGTGPFVVDSVETGRQVVLAAREDYDWAPPSAQHTGRAYLDTITISSVPEDSVRTGSLLTDQLDVVRGISAASIAQVEAADGFSVATRPSAGVPPYLALNLTDPVLADETVRQALQVGVDRQEIVDTLYTQYEPAATGILTSGVPGAVDLSDDLAYDPTAATAALEADGWTAGEDGIRTKDGQRLALTFQFTLDTDKALGELLQQQFKEIGVEFTLQQLTTAQVSANQASGDWQVAQGNLTRPDADVLLSVFDPRFSSRYKDGSVYPELVDLLAQIAAEPDSATRADLSAQAQRSIVENAYAIPVKEQVQVIGLSDRVQGFRFDAAWWPVLYDVHLSGE